MLKVFSELNQGILISDVNTDEIIQVNQIFTDTIGYTADEIAERSFVGLFQKIGLERTIVEFTEKSSDIYKEEITINDRYGKPVSAEILFKPIEYDNKQLLLTIFHFLEHRISDSKLNMIMKTINACNRSILETHDLPTLTKQITDHIINYSNAAISIVSLLSLDGKQELDHVAVTGMNISSISDDIISMKNTNIATALDYGETIVIHNIDSDNEDTPISLDFVKDQNIKSVLLLPLHAENITFGVISIFTKESNSFPEIIIEHYNSLADNLSDYIIKLLFEDEEIEKQSPKILNFIHDANNILTGFNGIIAELDKTEVDTSRLNKIEESIERLTKRVNTVGEQERKTEDRDIDIIKGSKEWVLVVDDDYNSRKLVKEVLSSNDYSVISTSNPTDAIDIFDKYKNDIQLIVTDVMMDELSGIELASQIQEKKKDIKIIFISGYQMTPFVSDEIDSLDAPFLQKPFKPSTLLKTVKNSFH